MDDLRKTFGLRVRQLRVQRGISQEGLAELCGLDRTYIGGIERGERNPSLVNIGKIAISLGVRVADLFEIETKNDTERALDG